MMFSECLVIDQTLSDTVIKSRCLQTNLFELPAFAHSNFMILFIVFVSFDIDVL